MLVITSSFDPCHIPCYFQINIDNERHINPFPVGSVSHESVGFGVYKPLKFHGVIPLVGVAID